MGASGSIVANKDDDGVEVNIADEASSVATRAISRHHSQPPGTLLASLIPKKHGDGLHRPTANIRSSGSFDPSNAAMMLPDMNDKIRKEYDTLKFTKEQEIQALQRKEQKLDTENNRLRAELQALNKQCQKLRAERDIAMESSYEATERATALEQDREKIQRQFKIFRETKESEIQALLQAKRQFETQLQSLQAYGVATLDDQTYSKNDASNHLDDAMRPASEWWAPPESEATSLFGSYAQLRNGSNVGFAESAADIREQGRVEDGSDFVSPPTDRQPWLTNGNNLSMVLPLTNSTDICGSIILRCYVGGTPDVIRDLKSIVNHPELEATRSACEKEGYFLSVTNLTDLSDYCEERQENEDPASAKVELIQSAVHRSSIFIFIIGGLLGKYTDVECQEGHFNSPGSKSAFFCLKNSTQDELNDMPSADLKQRVTASHCRRKFHYETSEEVSSLTLRCISKAVQLEFGIKVSSAPSPPPGSADSEQHEVVCIDEMPSDEHMEQMQQSILAPPDIQPVGFEKSYERLDEVVTSPGPVPPLLISGTRGSGKTLLLASWIRRLKSTSPDIVVLQHFVTGIEALDADPVIMLRRLLSQLRHHLPLANQPPVQTFSTFDVTRLRETLPRWLEQLTSRRNNRILLVVDSIDLLKEAQRNFHWLLDPLHVGVRVVISAGVDSCPEEWRQFPTLHLEPLSVQSVKSLLHEHASFRGITLPRHTEREVVSQCRTATTCHPLYVALLSSVACSSCGGDSAGESLFGACLRSRDSAELYRVLLRDVESRAGRKQTRSCIKALFQFLVCSRGGLAETEIMGLVPDLTWSIWTSLRSQLAAYCVIDDSSGLVTLHNSEISSVLHDSYVSNEVQQRRVHHKMAHWLQQAFARRVTPRNSDLLLWLLHKIDDREALRKVLASPIVFHFMYSRGRACEVVRLWNFLNEEKSLLAGYYRDSLQRLEATTGADATSSYVTGEVTMSDVAQMYLSLGRFLKDLGLMEEAVSSLQKSLEIQESILDPDHPAVADSLHHLAAVYTQWGKLSTAEPLYRQALELVECAVGRDHLRIAQELSALVRINRKTGRREVADALQQRMLSIMKRNSSFGSNNFKRLMKRAVRLEELTLGDDTLDTAQALNDLGVLYHMQNNLDQAESFFKRSLKTREKLVGGSHLDVAQSYHNLAAVYNEKKNFKQASGCMSTALNIRKGLLHVGDPAVVTSMKYLAALYKKCKNSIKSAEVYRQILTATQQQSSPNSVPAANAMVNVAVAECELGQLDTALPLYERALEIYRKVLGHSSPQVYQALRNIAVLLYQKGNVAEAAAAYKQSMGGGSSKANSTSRW